MRLNVVLYQPEIPQNTGNIMRTCVATGARLHLIEPLGFSLDAKPLRRSATYHIPQTDYMLHADFAAFAAACDGPCFFMTRHASTPHSAIDFAAAGADASDLYLVFGRESTGLPHALIHDRADACFRIPMTPGTRSLNLSNAVCTVLYEALRQLGYPGLALSDTTPDSVEPDSFDEFIR